MLMDKSNFDELKEEIMEEKMMCPNCYSHSVKKKTEKKSKTPGTSRLENPEDKNIIYECLSCGKVFDKDYLLNMEMDL